MSRAADGIYETCEACGGEGCTTPEDAFGLAPGGPCRHCDATGQIFRTWADLEREVEALRAIAASYTSQAAGLEALVRTLRDGGARG